MKITKRQLKQIIRESLDIGASGSNNEMAYRRSADKMSEVVAGILGRPLEPQEYKSIYRTCADIYDAGMIEEVPYFSR